MYLTDRDFGDIAALVSSVVSLAAVLCSGADAPGLAQPQVVGWVSVQLSQGQSVVNLGIDRDFDVRVSCDGEWLLHLHQLTFNWGELSAKFSVIRCRFGC